MLLLHVLQEEFGGKHGQGRLRHKHGCRRKSKAVQIKGNETRMLWLQEMCEEEMRLKGARPARDLMMRATLFVSNLSSVRNI